MKIFLKHARQRVCVLRSIKVALVATFGAASLLEDAPVLRDVATFFTLGGLIGGAVVYRAERRGRELTALQVRQILFRWAFGGAFAGSLASLLAELL
jgi:hypothetical protein